MKTWLPLMDYAMKTGLSLSTLRRYIKSGKIEHRVEEGRYLVSLDEPALSSHDQAPAASPSSVAAAAPSAEAAAEKSEKFLRLQRDLQKAREEIAELKTLIALYEEHPPQSAQAAPPAPSPG